MIRLTFTAEEKELINYERFHHSHLHVQRKMEVLWCKSLGKSHQEIAEIAAVHPKAEFLSGQLQPRLDEAQAGLRAVFFVDAAHFVLAPFLGFLWCFARIFQAPSGRQRFNVLAALNAVTHDLVMVTNDSYITATSVCTFKTAIWNVLNETSGKYKQALDTLLTLNFQTFDKSHIMPL